MTKGQHTLRFTTGAVNLPNLELLWMVQPTLEPVAGPSVDVDFVRGYGGYYPQAWIFTAADLVLFAPQTQWPTAIPGAAGSLTIGPTSALVVLPTVPASNPHGPHTVPIPFFAYFSFGGSVTWPGFHLQALSLTAGLALGSPLPVPP